MSFLENIVRDDVPENILITLTFDIFFTVNEVDEVVSGSGINTISRKIIPEGFRPISFGYTPVDQNGNPIALTWQEITPFTASLPGDPVRTWSWDRENSQIYFRGAAANTSGENQEFVTVATDLEPPQTATRSLLVKCVLPISQEPVSWYLDPLDASTPIVRYRPLLESSFELRSSLKDYPYGALTRFSANLRIKNDTGILTPMLRSGKFAGNVTEIYRMSGQPRIENVRRIFSAELDRARIKDEAIDISIKPNRAGINRDLIIGHDRVSDVPSTTVAASRAGAKVRTVFGFARGMRLECISYSASISTSTNRTWLVCPAMGETSASVSVTSDSYGTDAFGQHFIYLEQGVWYWGPVGNERPKFRLGDRVRISDGSTTAFRTIIKGEQWPTPLGINLSGINYFLDSALPGSLSGDVTMSRQHASRAYLNQGGVAYELMPTRDYTTTVSGGYIRLVLTSSAESNVGANTVNPVEDFISGYFYGPRLENTTVNMGDVEIQSGWRLPSISHPAFVIYLLLTQSGALEAGEFSLEDLEEYFTDNLGDSETTGSRNFGTGLALVEPSSPFANRRTLEQVLLDIATTFNLFIYTDLNGVLRIRRRFDMDGQNYVVEEKDIIGEISYDHDYGKAFSGARANFETADVTHFPDEPSGSRQFTARSLIGTPFYGTSSIFNFNCVVSKCDIYRPFGSTANETTVRRPYQPTSPVRVTTTVANSVGVQRNIYKFRLKKRFSLIDFGDTVTLRRERLPGFPYKKGVLREITGDIVSIARSIDSVEVEIEDKRMKQFIGRSMPEYL